MSAIEALRAELGIDDLLDHLERIEQKVDAISQTRPFYTPGEVAKLLRKRIGEVERMLADGRLWTVQGLESSKRLIPQAAIDELQRRPALESVREAS